MIFWQDQWIFWGHWQAFGVAILVVVALLSIGVGLTEWLKYRGHR